MRTISEQLAAHLAGEALTLSTLVRVTRRDGTVYGLTDHDRDLTVAGVTYAAQAGVQVTTLQQSAGTGVDQMEVTGLLSDDRIGADDIRAGRFDDAEVLITVVNWADLTMGQLVIVRGHLGEFTLTDGGYKTEVRSLSDRFRQNIVELTSQTCRVRRLGDSECKVSLAGFQQSASVESAPDVHTLTFALTKPAGFYAFGLVLMTSGANAGIERQVQASAQAGGTATLTLQEAFPYPVQPGDAATLTAGCDRTLATCKAKFNNTVNFRGEPDVPGNTKILQTGRGQ